MSTEATTFFRFLTRFLVLHILQHNTKKGLTLSLRQLKRLMRMEVSKLLLATDAARAITVKASVQQTIVMSRKQHKTLLYEFLRTHIFVAHDAPLMKLKT